MLVDKFNRAVDLINIEASGACQYSCSHCSTAGTPGGGPLLETSRLIRFMKTMSLLGMRRARLIGGEPLLRPDIVELVGELSSIRTLSVSLSTNGALLAPIAGKLGGTALDRIFVALPSLDAALYGRITGHNGLEKAIAGLDAMKAFSGAATTVKMTILPGVNDHEIERMVEWAVARGFDIYLVEGFSPEGAAERLTMGEIVERLGKMRAMTRMEGVAVTNNPWKVDGTGSIVKIVTAETKKECETCNRLWLSAAGKLSLCSIFPEPLDLNELFDDDPSDEDLARFAAMIPLNKPRGPRERMAPR
ncbi:MAG: radical SAM protein [Candidatus Nitrospinota bacterium M3_3B_026]